jgi:hypothetical protein
MNKIHIIIKLWSIIKDEKLNIKTTKIKFLNDLIRLYNKYFIFK